MNFHKVVKSQNVICFFIKNISKSTTFVPFELEPGIFPYPRRQIPLDGLKTFNERIREIEKAKSTIDLKPVNIGYGISQKEPHFKQQQNLTLEKLARKRQLHIDIYELDKESKNLKSSIIRKFNVATFYNVYNDLFHYPHFFYPIKNIDIEFPYDSSNSVPVYCGNLISPSSASTEPIVTFESDEKSLWTLVMSCPDEHLEHTDMEYVHWIISNISMKDGVIQNFDPVVPYLQPIPYLGTGFHRYVFVLYQQDRGRVNLSLNGLVENCQLEERTFSSYEFLKTHQESLTPVGMSFFQSAWDSSVREQFRENLHCLEPIFEYNWPKEKLKPMKMFPENEVMHTYFDQYRDVKDIQEEVLKERLKTVDPFKVKKQLEFPLAVPDDPETMGFMKEKFKDRVLRRNQWKAMDVIDDVL